MLMMRSAALFLNLIVSLTSAALAIVALVKPQALSSQAKDASGSKFYPQMYAARALPSGVLFGILPYHYRGIPVACILLCAALIQLSDAGIGTRYRNRQMTAGGIMAALVHFWCMFALNQG